MSLFHFRADGRRCEYVSFQLTVYGPGGVPGRPAVRPVAMALPAGTEPVPSRMVSLRGKTAPDLMKRHKPVTRKSVQVYFLF